MLFEDIAGLLRRHAHGHCEQGHAVGFASCDAQQARVLGRNALGRAGIDHQIDEASALVGKECSDFIAGAGVLPVPQGDLLNSTTIMRAEKIYIRGL